MTQQSLLSLRCVSVVLVVACSALQGVNAQDANAGDLATNAVDTAKKQVPTSVEAAEAQAKAAAERNNNQVGVINERIKLLQQQQAAYIKNVASGVIKPNQELLKQWSKAQQDLATVRSNINTFNGLAEGDLKRVPASNNLLSSLQAVGHLLTSASHPKFTPITLSASDRAEVDRISQAMNSLQYGDRSHAKPVEVLAPQFTHTLIHLPIPIRLKAQPGEKIYLSAETGGAFNNGLSVIELKADKKGIASTSWVSIGDAVGKCILTIKAASAIENGKLQFYVVAPKLIDLKHLPKLDRSLLKQAETLKDAINKSQ